MKNEVGSIAAIWGLHDINVGTGITNNNNNNNNNNSICIAP